MASSYVLTIAARVFAGSRAAYRNGQLTDIHNSSWIFLCYGLVALYACNIGRAQDALSPIVCNKNYTNNTIALEMRNVGACSGSDQSAAKLAAIQNRLNANQAAINGAGNALLSVMSLFGNSSNDNVASQPDPAAVAAASRAAAQARTNAEASAIFNDANRLAASLNQGANPSGAGPTADPSATSAISAMLSNPPSKDPTAQIGELLGRSNGSGSTAGDSTNTIVGLLGSPAAAPSAATSAGSTNTPPSPGMSQWYTPPAPLQDQDMNTYLDDSVDQPDPSMFGNLSQQLRSGLQTIKGDIHDSLNGLVTSGTALIAPVVNDPGVQAIYRVVSNGGATMPLTNPTDSGDTMVRNVAGQALLGSTDLVKSGPVAGRDTAGRKMIEQYSSYMGWAQANVPTIADGAQP